jgi:hypothetical protein
MEWQPISTAPRDSDIEVCVIEGEPHVLTSACRLTDAGWIDARTKRLLDIHPTHWREWQLRHGLPPQDLIRGLGELGSNKERTGYLIQMGKVASPKCEAANT